MDLNILCFAYIASFFIFTNVIYANTTKSLNYKLFDIHQKRVDAFQKKHPCGEPVETLVPLTEVNFNISLNAKEQIFPKITVLHRCNSYSLCKQLGILCAQENSETVALTFFVSSIDATNKYFVTGYAQNHTSCSCLVKK